MNRLLKSLSFGLLAGTAAVVALWLAGPPRYTSDRVLPAGVRLDGWDDYAAGLRLNEQTRRVDDAMDQPLARPLRLAGVPLDEAIVAFSKAVGVDVAVQWNSFDDTANVLRTPITLAVDAGGASAADVLDGLVATRGRHDIAFTWCVQDGRVIVRAEDQSNDPALVTRVYDVRDLMLESARLSRQFHPTTLPAEARYGNPPPPGSEQEASEALTELIGELADYNYKDYGRRFTYWGGRLIAVQTPEAQRKIARELARLRATLDLKGKP